MINLLHDVKCGRKSSEILIRAENSCRLFNLQIDKFVELPIPIGAIPSGINTLNIDNEQRYLLSGKNDGQILIYDTRNDLCSNTQETSLHYKCLFKLCKTSNASCHQYSVNCIKWYKFDNGMFFSCSSDRTLKIWDTNRLKVAAEYIFPGPVYRLCLSNIAKRQPLIAVGSSSNSIKLIDIRTGSDTHKLFGHTELISALSWSNTSETILASGSDDHCIYLWDIRQSKSFLYSLDQHNGQSKEFTRKVNAHNGAISSLEFSSDGLYLSSFGVDDRLRLWDAYTAENLLVNYGRVPSNPQVEIALSSNSNPGLLFVPSENNVFVFSLISGELVSELKGHFNCVNTVCLNQSKLELYSGSNDRNIVCWSGRNYPSLTTKKQQNLLAKTISNNDWDSD